MLCADLVVHSIIYKGTQQSEMPHIISSCFLILTCHFYTEAVVTGEQQSMSQAVILLKLTD